MHTKRKVNTVSSLRLEKPITECHKLLIVQVVTPWGLGVGAAPQSVDKGSTGVNIEAGQRIKDIKPGIVLHVLFCFQVLSANAVY